MKIVILNGSPKGDQSVTLQYVRFIQKSFPEHSYEIINISQKIKKIEKNEEYFDEIIEKIKVADGVLWAFPLYLLLVPAQYKRFIELITERKVENIFANKYTAVLTTSVHFYDHTAHNYMRGICEDLDMKYVDGISPHMRDLEGEKFQKNLRSFADNLFYSIQNNLETEKNYNKVEKNNFKYKPSKIDKQIDAKNKKILILTDNSNSESNITKMVNQFKNNLSGDVEIANINDLDMVSGCVGCIRCGYDNTCQFDNSDDFREFYDSKIFPADIIVYAGEVVDRYLSSRWKMFFDRRFFFNHVPTQIDKQILFLISGSFRQIPNIQDLFTGWTQIEQGNLVGIITDEVTNSKKLDEVLSVTAEKAIRFSEMCYIKPQTFLGVAGMKLFRDEIYASLRFPFRADYKYYKSHGLLDFPRRGLKMRMFQGLMFSLSKFKNIQKDIYLKKMKSGMMASVKKIVDKM